MKLPAASAAAIETYLESLRRGLRGLPAGSVREIVEELRAHLVDELLPEEGRPAPSVDAVLAALGEPGELAAQYRTDALLTRAATSRSPLVWLGGLLGWASASFVGLFVLLGAVVGYLLAAALVLLALLKPFHPQSAGLWLDTSAAGELHFLLQYGFEAGPAAGRELLGWWIVPIGLAFGYGLAHSTTRLVRRAARAARASRRPLST